MALRGLPRRWLPRSAAGWTVAAFGALAVLLGALGLGYPAALLGLLGFDAPPPGSGRAPGDHTAVLLAAAAVASFNMGVYYLLAAATDWRPFFRFTVVFRLVTFVVFSLLVVAGPAPAGFFGVALWEAVGALSTGVALWCGNRRRNDPTRVASDVGQ